MEIAGRARGVVAATAASMMGFSRRFSGKCQRDLKRVNPKVPFGEARAIASGISKILKDHGPLTVAGTWNHVKGSNLDPAIRKFTARSGSAYILWNHQLRSSSFGSSSGINLKLQMELHRSAIDMITIRDGIWHHRTEQQNSHENLAQVDEGTQHASSLLRT